MAQVWHRRERELASLSQGAWTQLKSEAKPYLARKETAGRGWAQLIAILNQARAYNYMQSLGCADIQFIPRARTRRIETPDLKGLLNYVEVLCEVKTIGASDIEIAARRDIKGSPSQNHLSSQFLEKLDLTLKKAASQLTTHQTNEASICVAFLVINFDDWLGEYKEAYYRQIDIHLLNDPCRNYRIVIYNQITAFHTDVEMKNAKVINEEV